MVVVCKRYSCDKCSQEFVGQKDFRKHKKEEHPYTSETRSLKVTACWQSLTIDAKISRLSGLKKGVLPGDNTSGTKPYVGQTSDWKRQRKTQYGLTEDSGTEEGGGEVDFADDEPMLWQCELDAASSMFQCNGCGGKCPFFPFNDVRFLEVVKCGGLPIEAVDGYVVGLIKKAMQGAESDVNFEDMLKRSLTNYFVAKESLLPVVALNMEKVLRLICRGRLCSPT